MSVGSPLADPEKGLRRCPRLRGVTGASTGSTATTVPSLSGGEPWSTTTPPLTLPVYFIAFALSHGSARLRRTFQGGGEADSQGASTHPYDFSLRRRTCAGPDAVRWRLKGGNDQARFGIKTGALGSKWLRKRHFGPECARPRAQRAPVVPMRPIPLGLARVPTLLRPRTGALRRGDLPPSLTQYQFFHFFLALVSGQG